MRFTRMGELRMALIRASATISLLAILSGASLQHFTTLVAAQSADPPPSPAALIARAKVLELNTPYVPPPGDPLVHHAAGFAQVMCSAVFITGLDPDFAAENVGYFTAPYQIRAKLGKPVVDREHKQVHVAVPHGITRTAVYLGDQGCVTLPVGQGVAQLHARQAQNQFARWLQTGLADGRRASQ
jgi:hypothetical protein